jgi:D-alanine transaminase
MNNIIYLNGQFIPQKEASISVMDRGFLFSDAIYEVIPVSNGRMIAGTEHLERLERSLDAIKIHNPLSMEAWLNTLNNLLNKNNKQKKDASFYIQVTRGEQPFRSHPIPQSPAPTVFILCGDSITKPVKELAKGMSAITVEDKRRQDCYIKATALLPNILAHQEAVDAGAQEAILIRDGFASEGTSSNLFIIKNKQLITPPLSVNILSGITRKLVIEIAKSHEISYKERPIIKDELYTADEIWLTGSSKEIVPIIKLDGQPVGTENAGHLWHKMINLYQHYKHSGAVSATASARPEAEDNAPL